MTTLFGHVSSSLYPMQMSTSGGLLFYNKGDYNGFIFYSDYALNTGWYNSKLYYDRGTAFERLHDYRKAKKEYKRALKKGYYPAQSALKQCKINQKNWKKSH